MQELEKTLLKETEQLVNMHYEDDSVKTIILRNLRDIRKHMNDGWTPVDERLPSAGQRVVATIKHHAWISDYDQDWVPESEKIMHQEYTESCEAVMTENGIWSYRCKEDDYDIDTASVHPGKSLNYPIAEVIAWRPLPEPYRPKRSDNHDGK